MPPNSAAQTSFYSKGFAGCQSRTRKFDSAFLRLRPRLQRALTFSGSMESSFFRKQTSLRNRKNFHKIAQVIAVLRQFSLHFRFGSLLHSNFPDAGAALGQACPQAGKILVLQGIQALLLQTVYDLAESTIDEPQTVRNV